MIPRVHSCILAGIIVGYVFPPPLDAAPLVVDVTSNGAGSTLWSFSGTATIGGTGGWYFYGVDQASFGSGHFHWEISDDFKPATEPHFLDAYFTADFPAPVLTGDGRSYNIVSLGVSNAGTTDHDTLGFFVGGGNHAGFSAGDVLSWSGQGVVNKDISGFKSGTYTASNSNYGWGTTLDLEVNVANPSVAVPEPSSIAMFGIGALGLFGYSRRRRRQTSAAA